MDINDLLDLPVRVYVSASGAGSGIQDLLWSVPGASHYLVGGIFPYAKEALTKFLGYEPEKFCGPATAMDMAITSYLAASNGDPAVSPVGLGITASVASKQEHRGDHRVYGAVVSRHGIYASHIVLPKDGPDGRRSDGGTADNIGMDLVMAAVRPIDQGALADFRAATEGKLLRDASAEALLALYARPLFTRNGQRLNLPTGKLKMLPGAFNPVHEGHYAATDEQTIFQITAKTPHKEPLGVIEILDRLQRIRGRDVLILEKGATYLDKARMFPGTQFVIGTDTLARIMDPKWGYDPKDMLQEIDGLGVTFSISPRDFCDQVTAFKDVPKEYMHLFTVQPQHAHSGLSSTAIRSAR